MHPSTPRPTLTGWERWLLPVLFLAWILSPGAAALLGVKGGGESFENRSLAKFPKLRWKDIRDARFGPRFERWLNDHLPLRDKWLLLDHRFDYFVLGDSPVPDEIVLGPEGSMWRLDRLHGRRSGPRPSSKAIIESIESFDAIARERGFELIVVTSPTKGSIYPELMPERYRAWFDLYSQRPIDELAEYARTPGTPLVDVWTPMRAERDRLLDPATDVVHPRVRYLFRLTDRHWNVEAAAVQAKAIVEAIDGVPWNPSVIGALEEPYTWRESELSTVYVKLGLEEPYSSRLTADGVHTRAQSKRLADGLPTVRYQTTYDGPDAPSPRHVLVVRDSFLNLPKAVARNAVGGGVGLLAAHFERLSAVHLLSVLKQTDGRDTFIGPVDVVVLQVVQDNSVHFVKKRKEIESLLQSLEPRVKEQ